MSDTNTQAQSQETTARTRRTQAQMAEARGEAPISDAILARIIEATEQRLATRPNPMGLNTFEEIESFAERAARSQMVSKDYFGKPDNIIIAVMKGKEFGMPPIRALESIAIVNGRSSLWGSIVEGMCYASGLVEDHEEHFEGTEGTDDFTAVCTVKRKGISSPKVGRFSQADAKKAGLFGQAVHGKYPRRMMQWRAKHPAFNDAFPDVLNGIAIRELEIEDAVATPGWTMPVPEKGWFTHKPQTQSDGWDDTWFAGVVQKLAGEPNAWKWLDLFVNCIGEAPTIRDVEEINDLPIVHKTRETAPDDALNAMDAEIARARLRLAEKPKETIKRQDQKVSSAETVHIPLTQATKDAVKRINEADERILPSEYVITGQSGVTVAESDLTPSNPTFEAWLVDGEGTAVDGPDGEEMLFRDPVAFAQAYVDFLASSFPGDHELIKMANSETLIQAQIASAKVARILAGPAPGAATPATESPLLPMELPSDTSVVAAPVKPTKGEFERYMTELKAAFDGAMNPEAFNQVADRNSPVYTAFKQDSQRLRAMGIAETRQKELSPKPTNGSAVPQSYEALADSVLLDIASFETAVDMKAWRAFEGAQNELALLRDYAPALHERVEAAAKERERALNAPIPTSPTPRDITNALMGRLRECQDARQFNALSASPDYVKDAVFIKDNHPELWTEVKAAADKKMADIRAATAAR